MAIPTYVQQVNPAQKHLFAYPTTLLCCNVGSHHCDLISDKLRLMSIAAGLCFSYVHVVVANITHNAFGPVRSEGLRHNGSHKQKGVNGKHTEAPKGSRERNCLTAACWAIVSKNAMVAPAVLGLTQSSSLEPCLSYYWPHTE